MKKSSKNLKINKHEDDELDIILIIILVYLHFFLTPKTIFWLESTQDVLCDLLIGYSTIEICIAVLIINSTTIVKCPTSFYKTKNVVSQLTVSSVIKRKEKKSTYVYKLIISTFLVFLLKFTVPWPSEIMNQRELNIL